MPRKEQIDAVVIESLRRIHLENHEWTFRDDALARARQITVEEGLLGESRAYKIGSTLLGLVGRVPGGFLETRRYLEFPDGFIGDSIERLIQEGILEERREPRDDIPQRRRIQYSLTDLHPFYGLPENRVG